MRRLTCALVCPAYHIGPGQTSAAQPEPASQFRAAPGEQHPITAAGELQRHRPANPFRPTHHPRNKPLPCTSAVRERE